MQVPFWFNQIVFLEFELELHVQELLVYEHLVKAF